jgi:hypothetical protein
MERERQRREADPDGVGRIRRLAARRYRAQQPATGLIFFQILQRRRGDRASLALILRE